MLKAQALVKGRDISITEDVEHVEVLALLADIANQLRAQTLSLIVGEHFEEGNVAAEDPVGDAIDEGDNLMGFVIDDHGRKVALLQDFDESLRAWGLGPAHKKALNLFCLNLMDLDLSQGQFWLFLGHYFARR